MSHAHPDDTADHPTSNRQGLKRAPTITRRGSAPEPAVAEPSEASAPEPARAPQPETEWAVVEPTEKDMGLVRLTLDKGVKTTAIGQVYGLDFEIEGDDFNVRVFFDNYNRRLKVIDYSATNYRALCERLIWLANANEFDKIFIKADRNDWQEFLCLGFVLEGILKYYDRGEDAFVMSRFSSLERALSQRVIAETDLIETLMRQDRSEAHPTLADGLECFACKEQHIPELVALYRHVFRTYPNPLTHPDYIQQTMRRNMLYRAVCDQTGHIISAASAEMDTKHSNAELTDCATSPECRGGGLMNHLLSRLGDDLIERDIQTGYSLARARSHGMNRVFYSLGYEYSGRLINNCDINGQFEDMNIWVKLLESHE